MNGQYVKVVSVIDGMIGLAILTRKLRNVKMGRLRILLPDS